MSAETLGAIHFLPKGATALVSVSVRDLLADKVFLSLLRQVADQKPKLLDDLGDLSKKCRVDLGRDVDRVTFARILAPEAQSLLWIRGTFRVADLTTCIKPFEMEAASPGDSRSHRLSLQDGRILSLSISAHRLAVATGDHVLQEALDAESSKGGSRHSLRTLAAQIDVNASAWALGQITPQVGLGISKFVGEGASPAQNFIATMTQSPAGMRAMVQVEVGGADDAAALQKVAKSQLGGIALFAPNALLQELISEVRVQAEGAKLRFSLELTQNQWLSLPNLVDTSGLYPQNPPLSEPSRPSASSK